MAKKKKSKKGSQARDHLSTHDSFRFALNIAVLATLLGVMVYLAQSQFNFDSRSKASSPKAIEIYQP